MDAGSSDREEHADASVTVVVPALNTARTLRRQLDALDRQTFERPFCVVVVDNTSEDNTAEVALGMQPERYQIHVVHEPGAGSTSPATPGLPPRPKA